MVKADGLAAGKGVSICKNFSEAQSSVNEIFKGKFCKADSVLIEEFLKGEEMSFFLLVMAFHIKILKQPKTIKEFLKEIRGQIQVEWELTVLLD